MKMNDHDTHLIAPHLLDDLTHELERIIELHEGESRPSLDRRLSRIVDVAQSRMSVFTAANETIGMNDCVV